MRVRLDMATIRRSRWHGHILRFVLGGAITAVAGLVAKALGPAVGGFLLAFPAILPAALLMSAKLQNEQAGPGATGARGRRAAIVAAAGAATASSGLLAFAVIVWRSLGHVASWLALGGATLVWAVTAGVAWVIRKHPVHRG